MWVFLNGSFIAEEQAVVSIFDRSFRYGDGLFEAVLVRHGKMFRWPQHAQRLERSVQFFKMALPCPLGELEAAARELIAMNAAKEAVLRVQLSRGTGPRGYAPTGEQKPLIVMSLHPTPDRAAPASVQWKLTLSSLRIPAGDPLSNHKTCSRLIQVLAAAEARERGADEALLINTDGHVTEGSTSNVFWIENGKVCTPALTVGALPGVTRAAVLELCDVLNVPCGEQSMRAADLYSRDGVFLSLTSRGIVEAESLDGRALQCSPITRLLQAEFEALIERECSKAS